jgi:hypothetical protein
MVPVVEAMNSNLKQKRSALEDLKKQQKVPGSNVPNVQIDQATSDYNKAADLARSVGIRVPAGEVTGGPPKIESPGS